MSVLVGYTPATGCTGGPTPGARALMAWYLATYPDGRNDGIYNCRPVRGGRTWSTHAEGRADDLGTPLTGAPPAWATELAARLVATSAELGVQCVIWHRRIWSSAHPHDGWRPYPGVDPHDTHMHVELTRTAGRSLTEARITSVLAEPRPPTSPPREPTMILASSRGVLWLLAGDKTKRKILSPVTARALQLKAGVPTMGEQPDEVLAEWRTV